jgi:hypothetical protein
LHTLCRRSGSEWGATPSLLAYLLVLAAATTEAKGAMAACPTGSPGRSKRLRRLRDEGEVHLPPGACGRARGFDDVEKRWHQLEGKLKVLREESRADLAEIREAAGLLAQEIRDAYRHLKSLV